MENNKIILYPKYVEDFKCDGTKCNAKCCGHWRIYIDRESYKKYQRIKNPAMRRKILSALQPCDVTQGFEVTLGKICFAPCFVRIACAIFSVILVKSTYRTYAGFIRE